MSSEKLPEGTGLHSIAAPIEQTLPKGVSLDIGVVAAYPPQAIQIVTSNTLNIYDSQREAAVKYGEVTKLWEKETAQVTATLRNRLETEAKGLRERAQRTDSFALLLEIDELHGKTQRNLANITSNPIIERLHDEISQAAGNQFSAEQRVLELQEEADLATAIHERYRALGRRGRLASYAAGLILGIGSIFATNHLTELSANKATTTTTKEYVEPGTHDPREQMLGFFIFPTASIVGGYLIGSMSNDRFAQGRARRIVRKAQKRTAKAA